MVATSGSTGCVAWMFDRKGLFVIPNDAITEEALFELALEAGADDVSPAGDAFEVTCSVDVFQSLQEVLEANNLPTSVAEFARIPANTVDLDVKEGRRVLKLLEGLEDQDDVQSVTANFNISDEIMQELIEEG